jgi:hypothetical protein
MVSAGLSPLGPSFKRAIRVAANADAANPQAARARTSSLPASPPPTLARNAMPPTAPMAAAMVPDVGVSAFAVMRSRPETTCGSEAERPARTNRPTPRTVSTARPRSSPSSPTTTSAMMGSVARDLTKLARTRTSRRRHRSRKTPANGPIIEYGSSRIANAAATLMASGWRSGEKRTKVARAAWRSPSEN